jgi:putative ABC transport system permease protein
MGLTSWGLEPVRPGRLRLGGALALYRRRLRRGRWVQDLLAIVGIAAGVALLYATQVAATSLSGPVARLNEGIVGAGQLQVLARGGATIDERTYARIVELPGVRRAAPVLQVPGNLSGPRGQMAVTFFGADPRIVQLRGSLLQGFSSTDIARQTSVVVPEPAARNVGLRFGDDIRLQIDGRSVAVPSVVAGRQQIGGLVDTSLALVPLRYLQQLASTGRRVSRILVQAEPDRVQQVREELQGLHVPGTDVRSSTYETKLFNKAVMPTSAASTIFAVLSAMVGWLFAVCALLVTASDRRRLVEQQRRQGFPPSATLTTLLVDAAVIGIAGVALGLAAGEALSRHGFSSDVGFLSGAFPIGDVRIVTWQSVAIASLGGLLAAAIGVLAPVRELVVQSFRPQPAVAHAAARPRRPAARIGLAAGSLALAASVAITIFAPAGAVVGLVLLGIAVACLLPLIVDAGVLTVERTNRRGPSSAAIELALHQLRARRWRSRGLAIATIGAIAVFGATALQGARLNLQHGLDDLTRGLSAAADVWVTAPGAGSSIGTSSFAPRDLQRLTPIPAVGRVDLYRAALLDVADHRAWVLAPPQTDRDAVARRQILEGPARSANTRLRGGGWATVSRSLADALHLKLGQPFTLPSPVPVSLRLAAITTNLGWSSGAIVVSARDFERGWTGNAVAAYHLQLRPHSDPVEAGRVVAQRLGTGSGLMIETAAQRAARQSEVARSGLSRLRQITLLTIIAAVLAMTAAMTGLLWQHRRSVARHKLVGMPTGLLWRSLLVETGVLFGIGVLAGGAFGLLGQILCTRGVERVTGFPVITQLQPGTALATAGLVLATSLVAVLVPGYLVARATPSARE